MTDWLDSGWLNEVNERVVKMGMKFVKANNSILNFNHSLMVISMSFVCGVHCHTTTQWQFK